MATRIFRLKSQLVQTIDTSSTLLKSKINTVQSAVSKIELPERFKGTAVEKWAGYWKNLYIDYRDVALDAGKQIKTRPYRSGFLGITGSFLYYCARHNPTEKDFIEELRKFNSDLILVDESCHKPEAAEYLKFLERAHNQGLIRTLNLGALSLMWLHDYDAALGVYKATCLYTKPDYLHFRERIVDVGFLDRWWKLDKKMIDYDVNEENV